VVLGHIAGSLALKENENHNGKWEDCTLALPQIGRIRPIFKIKPYPYRHKIAFFTMIQNNKQILRQKLWDITSTLRSTISMLTIILLNRIFNRIINFKRGILLRSLALSCVLALSNCQSITNSQHASSDNQVSDEYKDLLKGCGFTSYIEVEKEFLPPEDRVVQIVNSIVSFAGLPSNFSIYRNDFINNAFASSDGTERYIVYDSELFHNVELYSQAYWSSVFILAHEIGHHLSGHTLDAIGSSPRRELEADKFAGHVIHKMGGSLEDALAAATLIASDFDSETHPSKVRRLKVIEEGWNQAYSQRYNAAIPPRPNDEGCSDVIYTQQDLLDQIYFLDENDQFMNPLPDYGEGIDFDFCVITKVSQDYASFDIRMIN
jgi:hypothetical protein